MSSQWDLYWGCEREQSLYWEVRKWIIFSRKKTPHCISVFGWFVWFWFSFLPNLTSETWVLLIQDNNLYIGGQLLPGGMKVSSQRVKSLRLSTFSLPRIATFSLPSTQSKFLFSLINACCAHDSRVDSGFGFFPPLDTLIGRSAFKGIMQVLTFIVTVCKPLYNIAWAVPHLRESKGQ